MKKTLSVVVPVFNESPTIFGFCETLGESLSSQVYLEKELVFVNDGSSDDTLSEITSATIEGWTIKVLNLSRNFGKEAALTAGLAASSGDAVVVIDVDLQDPPNLINQMLELWNEGYKVVLGQRSGRQSDSFFKRFTAKQFYKLHNSLSDLQIPQNVGDFRLMDRQVVNEILRLSEANRFMKGIFAWVGFETSAVLYERERRKAGFSKFSPLKLWNLAIEGVTSFSTAPLKVVSLLGVVMAISGFTYSAFLVSRVLITGVDLPGWSSLIVSVVTLSGIQLLGIGILGEYIGRTYMESKGRPLFVVESTYINGLKATNE